MNIKTEGGREEEGAKNLKAVFQASYIVRFDKIFVQVTKAR